MRIDLHDLSDINIPEFFNIAVACIESGWKQDKHHPENIAIIVDTHDEQVQQLSYSELAKRSNQVANALQKLGCHLGDRVMLCLPNCIEFPLAFFGTLKLGAIAVPSSMLLSGDELDYLAKDSGAKILVTTPDHWEKLKNLGSPSHNLSSVILITNEELSSAQNHQLGIYTWHSLMNPASGEFEACKTKANDPAYLVYTSGTTGYPKGVLHAHRALLGRIPAARRWFEYDENQVDRILHSGKFNWTYVLGTALMDPLLLGKTVVVYEGKADAETWPKLIAKHQCTIFIGVPTLYRQIIQKTDISKKDVQSLRYCMCAGEHLSDELYASWKQRFGLTIYEAIGMSECSYYLSQHPTRAVKPGSAGFPQPGHFIFLLNENLEPVADNEEGMLCIGLEDPGLFLGYWHLEDTTKASRKGNFFLTGDYAYRDSDGYIWFLGRKDDLINSFGYRISPHEIERVIKTHPDIADCVALEETIGKDKNIVVAHVILHQNANFNEQAIIDFAHEHLAKYKVPKKLYVMNDFPRTTNGKVLRKELRNTFLNKSN
ncbi:MAG: acetyl-CoA synthetase [Oleiphilaceae bacterium]